jgi:hypothetical protein
MAAEPVARLAAHVALRRFPNETVAVNLESGHYFGLNPTAADMLDALLAAATIDAAADAVARANGWPREQVGRDLRALCVDLVDRELVELREPPH